MKTSEIRQIFLQYFASKGHQVVASSSLVPSNDPTLLFTNAGMVQFKETFLGQAPRSYTQAASAQRCVRAGGKHNDLENVGYTARHHTFFEMLGNFSFGDYFKRDAIHFAWEFLTAVLELPPEKLWVTVYEKDDEAADIWLQDVKVDPNRFSRCGDADNFWSMGDTGPCGPCTEIFYDHGPEIAGGPPGSADADGDRYIEIWNLVFMQFNRDKNGQLHPLPKPSVDTGMGLERIAAVMQGVHNNYDIDLFQHLILFLQQLAPSAAPHNPSFKVIADHIRSCAFLIADGVLPSNEGRGYVLRRIIRRAIRHGNKLGLQSPFFAKLVAPLAEVMGETYPELYHQREAIAQVLNQEENQFVHTLEQGLKILKEALHQLKGQEISGELAFKLYDTYGFPLDLTQDIAREYHLQVDVTAFDHCMQKQRELSQSSNQFSAPHTPTFATQYTSEFHGYEVERMQARVTALLAEGQECQQLRAPMKGTVVLDATPFYAESGGQVGDHGQLLSEQGAFRVLDTKKIGEAILHYGEMISGYLEPGQAITAQVDVLRRQAIRLNHTATHLLHAALKHVLGHHVQQKGSLVDAERARFDFSHSAPLTPEQIMTLENLVNERIRLNDAAVVDVMPIEAAKQSGAVALFGEKYGDKVRVLSLGDFSKELCGGTHAHRTGDIGLFKIIAEYGIASGVRRIEMMTGNYALHWVNQQLAHLDHVATLLKTTANDAESKLHQVLQSMRQQEKALQRLQDKLAAQAGQESVGDTITINNTHLLVKHLEGVDGHTLRLTLDKLKSQMERSVAILYAIQDNTLQVVAGISKDIISSVPPASVFVKHLCGKGGGRPDMAQGGGEVPADLTHRLETLKNLLNGEDH